MTMLLSRMAGIARDLALAEHDARRGAVAADDPQWQAVHLVHAGLDVPQVQALDDDRAAAEQDVMRRRARLPELLDREVIDAQHFDPPVDQISRPRFRDADVIGMELR